MFFYEWVSPIPAHQNKLLKPQLAVPLGVSERERGKADMGWKVCSHDSEKINTMRIKIGNSPLKAIRLKCMDCTCLSAHEIRICEIDCCPLWEFRFGKRPYRGGEKRVQ